MIAAATDASSAREIVLIIPTLVLVIPMLLAQLAHQNSLPHFCPLVCWKDLPGGKRSISSSSAFRPHPCKNQV
jgi:hypothetical protein